jgi:hypothetical protein
MPIRADGEGERVAVPRDQQGRWRDREVELGAEAPLGELAGRLPVALLERPAPEP